MPDSFDTQLSELRSLEADSLQEMNGIGRWATIYSCSQCPHHEHKSDYSKLGHFCTHEEWPREIEYTHTYTNPPDWCPLPFSTV